MGKEVIDLGVTKCNFSCLVVSCRFRACVLRHLTESTGATNIRLRTYLSCRYLPTIFYLTELPPGFLLSSSPLLFLLSSSPAPLHPTYVYSRLRHNSPASRPVLYSFCNLYFAPLYILPTYLLYTKGAGTLSTNQYQASQCLAELSRPRPWPLGPLFILIFHSSAGIGATHARLCLSSSLASPCSCCIALRLCQILASDLSTQLFGIRIVPYHQAGVSPLSPLALFRPNTK